MSERPTEADLRRLLDLAAKATPGPWKSLYYGYVAQTEDSLSLADADKVEDAEYIAAANPKAVTALATEVLRLETALKLIKFSRDQISLGGELALDALATIEAALGGDDR